MDYKYGIMHGGIFVTTVHDRNRANIFEQTKLHKQNLGTTAPRGNPVQSGFRNRASRRRGHGASWGITGPPPRAAPWCATSPRTWAHPTARRVAGPPWARCLADVGGSQMEGRDPKVLDGSGGHRNEGNPLEGCLKHGCCRTVVRKQCGVIAKSN